MPVSNGTQHALKCRQHAFLLICHLIKQNDLLPPCIILIKITKQNRPVQIIHIARFHKFFKRSRHIPPEPITDHGKIRLIRTGNLPRFKFMYLYENVFIFLKLLCII